MLTSLRAVALMLIATVAAGCAAAPGRTVNDDPWEKVNRGIYKLNDTVDRAALKPVARGYKKITPGWVRAGVGNFLANLSYPGTIVNEFLQGKGKAGLRGTGRFLVNTTLGVGGLFDVGTPLGLEATDEDFGQTLAVWGVSSGPFVNMPLFGPSSLRDAPSRVAGYFTSVLTYADVPWEAQWSERVVDAVHSRAELLVVDPTLQRTFDPYAFVRDAWVQRREFEIYDGNPPPEQLEDFSEADDATEAEPEPKPDQQ